MMFTILDEAATPGSLGYQRFMRVYVCSVCIVILEATKISLSLHSLQKLVGEMFSDFADTAGRELCRDVFWAVRTGGPNMSGQLWSIFRK